MQLSNQCQQEVLSKLNGHPVYYLRIHRVIEGHYGVKNVGAHDAREAHLLHDGGHEEVLDEGHAALNV